MPEYALGNKYVWTYASDVIGSTYNNRAYLDLGVITNTGTSMGSHRDGSVNDRTLA